MAGMAFNNLAAPAGAASPTNDYNVLNTNEATLLVAKVDQKVGKIQVSLLSQPYRDTDGHTVTGPDLQFRIWESADRQTWTEISATGGDTSVPLVVTPGGQEITNILSNLGYIRITGLGLGGSGYCKVDFFFNGLQFFGQMDFDVSGKSGFGLDGDTLDTAENLQGGDHINRHGVSVYGSDVWPAAPV